MGVLINPQGFFISHPCKLPRNFCGSRNISGDQNILPSISPTRAAQFSKQASQALEPNLSCTAPLTHL